MHWEGVPDAELAAKVKEGNGGFRLVTAFLQLLPVPAFVKDKRGRLLFLNSAARKLWKLRGDQGIGWTVAQLFKNPELDLIERASDRQTLRVGAAWVTAYLKSDPHFYTLAFPALDSDDDTLLGYILVRPTKFRRLRPENTRDG